MLHRSIITREKAQDWFNEALRRQNREEAAEHLRLQEIAAAKRVMHANSVPQWVVAIVLSCAAEYQISPRALLSRDRHRMIIRARQAAIYRVKDTKPKLSLPQLGKWFDRDHTTIAHAIAMHQRRHDLRSYTVHNVERHMEIMRLWHRAHRPLDQRQGPAR